MHPRTLSLILSSNLRSKTTLAANGSFVRFSFARFCLSSSDSCSPAASLSALFLFFSFFAAFSFARRSIFRSSNLAILRALFCAFFESITASEAFSSDVDFSGACAVSYSIAVGGQVRTSSKRAAYAVTRCRTRSDWPSSSLLTLIHDSSSTRLRPTAVASSHILYAND